ncbi:MAG: Mg2+/Co2+ transporter CorC [Bacteroidia bacterium]|jgi:Mg2+/Co2+ transporter CorC
MVQNKLSENSNVVKHKKNRRVQTTKVTKPKIVAPENKELNIAMLLQYAIKRNHYTI